MKSFMKFSPIFITLLIGQFSSAQLSDNLYVNGGILSSNSVTDVYQFNAGFSVPIFKNEKNSFSLGFDYKYTNYSFVDEDVPFSFDQLEQFYTYTPTLKYAHAFSNKWSLIIKGGGQLATNYDTNDFKDSYYFNGTILVRKTDSTTNSSWTFGATYNPQYGFRTPIPVIAYTKQATERWSYQIGIPEMYTKYIVGKAHTFSAFAKLDGFMGTFNDNLEIRTESYEDTGILRQTYVLAGFGYDLNLWKNSKLQLKAGKTFYNDLSILDPENNEVYNFDIEDSFYINLGINWTIPNKLLD
ncbi:DUF6268 family outer membrane beta-barrel protein [Neptunitalea lumnitzerae]|nr:DUF6268 family outer membrane beta-barrel protein [Neptunitalea sp. Y10]